MLFSSCRRAPAHTAHAHRQTDHFGSLHSPSKYWRAHRAHSAFRPKFVCLRVLFVCCLQYVFIKFFFFFSPVPRSVIVLFHGSCRATEPASSSRFELMEILCRIGLFFCPLFALCFPFLCEFLVGGCCPSLVVVLQWHTESLLPPIKIMKKGM